jgi:3-mercaptopyruvate sulfurtransferase SseA
MNTREKFSAALMGLGLILALLPSGNGRSFRGSPANLLKELTDESTIYTPDQVARLIVSEDSTLRLIDLRSEDEFRSFSIPKSVNVPYEEFIHKNLQTVLAGGNMKNILYSNGDLDANYALAVSKGTGHKNVFVMQGGLNSWFDNIMNSSFSGERITARENALFETRTRARKMFTEINSLPDSLRMKLLESKKLQAKKLDGGCE